MDTLVFTKVHLESWVYKGLRGQHDSILELLKENLHHYLCIEFDEGLNDTVVYIIGFKFFAMFAMFVIVSLACNLRTKRNRAVSLRARSLKVNRELVKNVYLPRYPLHYHKQKLERQSIAASV
ncbi:mCG15234, isoform CRA_c [Mus musculus]|nr:mCG15234, isoform CRA_c [Mus musculus]